VLLVCCEKDFEIVFKVGETILNVYDVPLPAAGTSKTKLVVEVDMIFNYWFLLLLVNVSKL
jgi:hypothetical protein